MKRLDKAKRLAEASLDLADSLDEYSWNAAGVCLNDTPCNLVGHIIYISMLPLPNTLTGANNSMFALSEVLDLHPSLFSDKLVNVVKSLDKLSDTADRVAIFATLKEFSENISKAKKNAYREEIHATKYRRELKNGNNAA